MNRYCHAGILLCVLVGCLEHGGIQLVPAARYGCVDSIACNDAVER